MSDLERKKKSLEMARVSLAKQELELKIEEKQDEIRRLHDAIAIQDKRIAELQKELDN
jgi:hypothetical protein